MNNCKKLENNSSKFSVYIHGFWLPTLEQMKKEGLKRSEIAKKIKEMDHLQQPVHFEHEIEL